MSVFLLQSSFPNTTEPCREGAASVKLSSHAVSSTKQQQTCYPTDDLQVVLHDNTSRKAEENKKWRGDGEKQNRGESTTGIDNRAVVVTNISEGDTCETKSLGGPS